MSKKDPILTEQTFHEAGGKELFGKLKMLGLVEIDKIQKRNEKYDQHSLDRLVSKARYNYGRVDYIFDIKYSNIENEKKEESILTGTAYRKKGLLRNYFSGWSW